MLLNLKPRLFSLLGHVNRSRLRREGPGRERERDRSMATQTVPNGLPPPDEDAECLRKAFKGWGANERAIIGILAHRDATRRTQIRQAYKQHYKEDLIKRLESELSGELERAMFRWIFEPAERDAVLAHMAMKKTPIDSHVIIEIACVRSPDELLVAKAAYHSLYKSSLEEDVATHAQGDLRQLLVALVGTYRYDGGEINGKLAFLEANILREAIEAKTFSHEEVIRILSTRSKVQLNAAFNRYKDEYGISITKIMKGDEFLSAMRAAILCLTQPHKYYEKVLRNAISKKGINEGDLTRVIVTRAEKDLREIMEVYHKRSSVTLNHAVSKEASGNYRVFLLKLLGE